jgi:hypothetical protein
MLRPWLATANRAGSSFETPFTMLRVDGVASVVNRWPTDFPVERPFDLAELEDWLQLGRKEQLTVALVVIERLDAHPVAGEQDLPASRVPDRKGEHAA